VPIRTIALPEHQREKPDGLRPGENHDKLNTSWENVVRSPKKMREQGPQPGISTINLKVGKRGPLKGKGRTRVLGDKTHTEQWDRVVRKRPDQMLKRRLGHV